MRIRQLFISPDHTYFGHHGQPAGTTPMLAQSEVECVAGRGLVGDRFFDYKDNYKGQITFFSLAVHEALCRQLNVYDRDASVFRRNVIVSEVDLNELIGQTFALQGLEFEGVEEAKPCYWMDQAFGPGAEAALRGRGGLRARILKGGVLRADP